MKQVFAALLLILLLFAAFAGVKYFQIAKAIEEGKKQGPPPDTVTSIVARKKAWPISSMAVGSLSAVNGAVLSIEEMGRVTEVNFESSSKVKSGQLLLALDTAVEEAQLDSAKAELSLATTNARRQRELREKRANSQSDLDNAEALLQQSQANVAMLKAKIERKRTVAPFDGYAGIRKINIGETVPAGTPVVSLQAYDPLYVDFSLPQNLVPDLEEGMELEIRFGALDGKVFTGKLTSIDSKIDTATRNIQLQGTVQNDDEQLRPGMFVDVTLNHGRVEEYIVLPITSVAHAPYGDSAFVILEGDGLRAVKNVSIKVGPKRGDQIAILSGIDVGDEVATSAVFKLRPDSKVIINNSVTPGNNPSPSPENG